MELISNLSEDKKNDILKILKDKGVFRPCQSCGNEEHLLLDGYFSNTLNVKDKYDVMLGNSHQYSIDSIVILCGNCAYVSQHALAHLNMMKEIEIELDSKKPKLVSVK